jgi:hypothetical protein
LIYNHCSPHSSPGWALIIKRADNETSAARRRALRAPVTWLAADALLDRQIAVSNLALPDNAAVRTNRRVGHLGLPGLLEPQKSRRAARSPADPTADALASIHVSASVNWRKARRQPTHTRAVGRTPSGANSHHGWISTRCFPLTGQPSQAAAPPEIARSVSQPAHADVAALCGPHDVTRACPACSARFPAPRRSRALLWATAPACPRRRAGRSIALR